MGLTLGLRAQGSIHRRWLSAGVAEPSWDAEDGGGCGSDQYENSKAHAEPSFEVRLKKGAGIHGEVGGGFEDGHEDEGGRLEW